MAREIDANLSRAFEQDVRISDSSRLNKEDNDSHDNHQHEVVEETSAFTDGINFDGEDIDALNAFSSLFGGLPAVKLGLVDISSGKTKGKN